VDIEPTPADGGLGDFASELGKPIEESHEAPVRNQVMPTGVVDMSKRRPLLHSLATPKAVCIVAAGLVNAFALVATLLVNASVPPVLPSAPEAPAKLLPGVILAAPEPEATVFESLTTAFAIEVTGESSPE
jgi:hypothetical protein